MRKLIYSILFTLMVITTAFSEPPAPTVLQLLLHNGGRLVVNGNPSIVINNGKLNNNGIITAGQGSFVFKGNFASTSMVIEGSSTTRFSNLVIDKSSNGITLNQNIEVDSNLQFIGGDLDLNGKNITLTNNGTILNETESNRIYGSTGEVIKTLALNAPTDTLPGNMGLMISSAADLGMTTIRRSHGIQTLDGQASIERQFVLTPTNATGTTTTLRFYYFDTELNGNDETMLEKWHNDTTNWSNLPRTAYSTTENYVETTVNCFNPMSLSEGALKFSPKVFLAGNYSSGLMHDSLRVKNLLPTSEPYAGLGFTHVGGGGGETIASAVLQVTGSDAIIDWVMVELRDKNDNTNVLKTKSVLLQRDGDVVDLDGKSPVFFSGAAADNYYVVIRHRNHLGFCSSATQSLSLTGGSFDFTNGSLSTYGSNALRNNGGVYQMWAGNGNTDGKVVYSGSGADNIPITTMVYTNPANTGFSATFPRSNIYDLADYNMDGSVIYSGSGSDEILITTSVYLNPGNSGFSATYPLSEQLPQ